MLARAAVVAVRAVASHVAPLRALRRIANFFAVVLDHPKFTAVVAAVDQPAVLGQPPIGRDWSGRPAPADGFQSISATGRSTCRPFSPPPDQSSSRQGRRQKLQFQCAARRRWRPRHRRQVAAAPAGAVLENKRFPRLPGSTCRRPHGVASPYLFQGLLQHGLGGT